MAKKTLKSAAGAAEEQLKAGAKKLQAQLLTAEKAAEKMATKARGRLPSASDVTARAADVKARAKGVVAKRGRGKTRSRSTPVTSSVAAGAPDDTWTVADLRAEAKRRGMTGYSRKNKAQLLEELGR
jgi:hypothetical protein